MLFRFVQAREYDVDKSIEMIVNDFKWRKEIDADNVIENWKKHKYYESLSKYWPAKWHGIDVDGSPVFWERIGILFCSFCRGQWNSK